jgi:hypothetical protein
MSGKGAFTSYFIKVLYPTSFVFKLCSLHAILFLALLAFHSHLATKLIHALCRIECQNGKRSMFPTSSSKISWSASSSALSQRLRPERGPFFSPPHLRHRLSKPLVTMKVPSRPRYPLYPRCLLHLPCPPSLLCRPASKEPPACLRLLLSPKYPQRRLPSPRHLQLAVCDGGPWSRSWPVRMLRSPSPGTHVIFSQGACGS